MDNSIKNIVDLIQDVIVSGTKLKCVFHPTEVVDTDFTTLDIISIGKLLSLSQLLPIIENHSLICIDMVIHTHTKHECDAYIHRFRVQYKQSQYTQSLLEVDTYDKISVSLEKVITGIVDNDRFNVLIACANLSWYQIVVLRAYAKYLKQVKFPYGDDVIVQSLSKNADITYRIIKVFTAKFVLGDKAKYTALALELEDNISAVDNTEDNQIYSAYLNAIHSTKRTNYAKFIMRQQNTLDDIQHHACNYMSFKICSSEIHNVPLPKPFMEIFVYSARFEAVHLRGGKIARGGIRWSDRVNDYRTEVLGLMEAQMMKNSIIIPVGSKGGFIVKTTNLHGDRASYFNEGIACYQLFLRGLLDITDNVIDGQVIQPKDVICYDDYDPYLVVAADKGTATFSDYANAISLEYNFWLGDAFASGGSRGYDHKKMAITARGAWISVQNLMMQKDIDVDHDVFTAVGIGDMSGDVFGNGMLLSKNIKLVAAFNHKHIFIDPEPNCNASYEERQRLFNKPFSQWSDYNPDLISTGGGVFERNIQQIKVTTQMQKALGISDNVTTMTPNQLISAILKAPVDLLWNGGIGTYVKASFENNTEVGDFDNDAVRVDANKLLCKVVAEGGNLGFTPFARSEYASNGGKINADFIDNSGGVDCSDHEVNIKIGLSQMLLRGDITLEERDILLTKMQSEVANLVLEDNMKQNLLLSIEEKFAHTNNSEYRNLLTYWSIDSTQAKLRDINETCQGSCSFTRPEIAIILAYVKNGLHKMLHTLDFMQDSYFEKHLLRYFPSILRERYRDALINHTLKNDIVRTLVVNDFINTMGIVESYLLMRNNNTIVYNVIVSFLLITESGGLTQYWQQIQTIPTNFDTKLTLLAVLQKAIAQNIRYMLYSWDTVWSSYTISEMSTIFAQHSRSLIDNRDKFVGASGYWLSGAAGPYTTEKEIESLEPMLILADIAAMSAIALKTGIDIVHVAKAYFDCSKQLSVAQAYQYISCMNLKNSNAQQAKDLLLQEIGVIMQNIVIKVLLEKKQVQDISDRDNIQKVVDCAQCRNLQFENDNVVAFLVILKQCLTKLL